VLTAPAAIEGLFPNVVVDVLNDDIIDFRFQRVVHLNALY
jgi:hypothetical protein